MFTSNLKMNAKKDFQANSSKIVLLAIVPVLSSVLSSVLYSRYFFNGTIQLNYLAVFYLISLLLNLTLVAFVVTMQEYVDSKDNSKLTFSNYFSFFTSDKFFLYFKTSILQALYPTLWGLIPVVGWIVGFIKALSYSQSILTIKDSDSNSSREQLAISKQLMNNRKWDYILLNLSFILWYILSIFTLGLLHLFIYPYVILSQIHFYNQIKKANK